MSKFGLPSITMRYDRSASPIGQSVADVACEPGDVVDDDRLAAVDDTDRLEADRAAGPGFDRAEGGLDRLSRVVRRS